MLLMLGIPIPGIPGMPGIPAIPAILIRYPLRFMAEYVCCII